MTIIMKLTCSKYNCGNHIHREVVSHKYNRVWPVISFELNGLFVTEYITENISLGTNCV